MSKHYLESIIPSGERELFGINEEEKICDICGGALTSINDGKDHDNKNMICSKCAEHKQINEEMICDKCGGSLTAIDDGGDKDNKKMICSKCGEHKQISEQDDPAAMGEKAAKAEVAASKRPKPTVTKRSAKRFVIDFNQPLTNVSSAQLAGIMDEIKSQLTSAVSTTLKRKGGTSSYKQAMRKEIS